MSPRFDPTSRKLRGTFAAAAVLATTLLLSAIGGLARHYNAESQLASGAAAVVAQR